MRMPGQNKRITSAADDGVVGAGAGTVLERVVVATEAAGITLSLHDCATEGAASAGNKVGAVKLDSRDSFEYGTRFAVGLVVIASGACDVTVVWS